MNNLFKMSVLATLVALSAVACSSGTTGPSLNTSDLAKTTPDKSAEEVNPKSGQPIVSLDAQGKKWRIVTLDGFYAGEARKAGIFDGNYYSNAGRQDSNTNNITDLGKDNDFLYKQENQHVVLNLDEEAIKDGESFYGIHKGSITPEKPLVGTDAKSVNYMFVNQSHSSYGMIFTDENNINKFIVSRYASGVNDNVWTANPAADPDFLVYKAYEGDNQKLRVDWVNNVKGSATYKGDVIATFSENGINSIPRKDGQVTINANFGNSEADSYFNGTLHSEYLGDVELLRYRIDVSKYGRTPIKALKDHAGYYISTNEMKGNYNATFVGKDLNNVVGYISLRGDGKRYDAVFGGTKQPDQPKQ